MVVGLRLESLRHIDASVSNGGCGPICTILIEHSYIWTSITVWHFPQVSLLEYSSNGLNGRIPCVEFKRVAKKVGSRPLSNDGS